MGKVIRARRERFEEWVGDEGVALRELGHRMMDGETLKEICESKDVLRGEVMAWLQEDARRWGVYLRCLKALGWGRVEEAVEIADKSQAMDSAGVAAAKLRVDTRFRQAALYDPERLSPKGGVDTGSIAEGITQALQRISERKQEEMRKRMTDQSRVVAEQ
jgi:hypothetical protein